MYQFLSFLTVISINVLFFFKFVFDFPNYPHADTFTAFTSKNKTFPLATLTFNPPLMNVYRIIKAKLLQFVVWKNTFGSSLLGQKSYATLLSFRALWSTEKRFCDRSVHRVIACLLTKLHSCEFLSRRKYCSLWSNINQRDESWTQHLLGLVPLIGLKLHRLQKNTKNAAAPKYSECSDLHCTDFWLKYALTRVTVWTRVKCWAVLWSGETRGGGEALLSGQFNTQTHRVSAKSLTWNTKAVHSSVAADVSFSLFFIRSFKHLVLLVSTCVAVFQFLPLALPLSRLQQ